MLPLLPDLLANLLVMFLPETWVTARVRALSRSVRLVTNTVVSRLLVCGSLVIPVLALYFQIPMLEFKGVRALTSQWCVEVSAIAALFVAVQTLYLATLLVSPGFVKKDSRPVEEGDEAYEKKGICKKCNILKPPRTHHCSICRRCVLRMDHHCPFTNCCVGLRNERFFVFWLFGIWIGCLYGLSVSWPPFRLCIMQGMFHGVESLSDADIARCVMLGKASFIFVPALSVFLFMCILGGWHLFLVVTNQTTIEIWKYKLGPLLGQRKNGGHEDAAPSYSLGAYRNVCDVLWPKVLIPFD